MNLRRVVFSKKIFWVGLGLLAVAVRAVAPAGVIEEYYSRGLFLFIRKIFGFTTNWLPFALVYILFFLLLFWLLKSAFSFYKNTGKWQKKILGAVASMFAFAGGAVFFFLVLWGYNYGRIPLEKQLKIEPKPLTANELEQELGFAAERAWHFRALLETGTDSVVSAKYLPADLERTMRSCLTKKLNGFGYPTPGRVRGRLLYPKGLLLRTGTAGVYVPFTGEGHVDPGLHYLQLPFVLAHEMSHGYGFGDEGTCNFLAYLACTGSGNDFLQYTGYLYYWKYVAADYRKYRPEKYKKIWAELPPEIKYDLRGIRREMDKYPDIFPAIRDAAYSSYLRAQGISEGLKNYNRIIMLVHAQREEGLKKGY
ncbi:MAG TPA: DUF3810 domain-containing protein [Bacteroidetes bacterium]|nr:DUF3810 domain-containing protein [Bacteroidota bacterium]